MHPHCGFCLELRPASCSGKSHLAPALKKLPDFGPTPSEQPTRSNRINIPKDLNKLLLENRQEHWRNFAAANIVQLTRI